MIPASRPHAILTIASSRLPATTSHHAIASDCITMPRNSYEHQRKKQGVKPYFDPIRKIYSSEKFLYIFPLIYNPQSSFDRDFESYYSVDN